MNLHTLTAMRDGLIKLAEVDASKQEEQPQPKPPHPALTAAKYLGGYGLGTAAGYGGVLGLQAASKKLRGKPIISAGSPLIHVLPALTGLGGLAFTHAQHSMFDKMREDAAKRRALGR